MMEHYNQIDSSFANRIFSMAEKEQSHTHSTEKTQLRTSIIMAGLGMLCGIAALAVLCYLLYYSIEKENTAVAIAITGILVAVVSIFVIRKQAKKN